MLVEELLDRVDDLLRPIGSRPEDGEEFDRPPLDILRYYQRPVRVSRLPVVGRASSVVAVIRQPIDLAGTGDGPRTLLDRAALAVNGRFRPLRGGVGVSVALTLVVLTPEPIRPEDDQALAGALEGRKRSRVIPLAVFRINCGQEALSMALRGGPAGLFPEPELLADALTESFRRFVPLLPG